ncbi:unnamed protein product [Knipowitschia caucasica]|uniref:TRIF N-terminal domain-containing protein n=1 Tax=Knipowitschia caucasica TaxID=637954 RepID=A0AAV2JUA2_KNICA
MSQQEIGDPGSGVKDVIDVLTKTPPKRLSSLTNQLGSSTEEDIVHALCLFLLQREVHFPNHHHQQQHQHHQHQQQQQHQHHHQQQSKTQN